MEEVCSCIEVGESVDGEKVLSARSKAETTSFRGLFLTSLDDSEARTAWSCNML